MPQPDRLSTDHCSCATCHGYRLRRAVWRRSEGNDPTDFNERSTAIPTPTATDARLNIYRPSHPEYPARMRGAFQFLRTHADGRYTATSLINLLNASEGASGDRPTLHVLEAPSSYDEETEVKTGGMVGVAVKYTNGKTLLAVRAEHRRLRHGSLLLDAAARRGMAPNLWVHRENLGAIRFLAAADYSPQSMNSQGALNFGQLYAQGEGEGVA